jgi:cytidylate kinase
MAVVTVNSALGTAGYEVGLAASNILNADYVDRLILAEAAKRIGSTVHVLEIKEQQNVPLRDRLAYFLQTMLERSAMSGAGGEPYFSPGMEYLPAEDYTDLAQEPLTAAQRLNDQHFLEVTSAVIKDLAKAGNVVIVGRGSNMILQDMPGVLHVNLRSAPELRAKTVAEKEHLTLAEAERYITDGEKARAIYYKKFFKADADDARLYHIVVNMGRLSVKTAAEIVAHAARDLESAVQLEPV